MGKPMLFTNANLFDGHAPRGGGMAVLCEDGRIKAVDREGQFPAEQERIDLGGRTLMPGMTVGHWHGEFVSIGPPTFAEGRGGVYLGTELPPALLAIAGANALRIALNSGVTRIVGGSCSNDMDAQLKMAVEKGLIVGPHITASSRHVVATADHEDRGMWWRSETPEHHDVRRIGHNVFADGPDAFTRAVRQEIWRGAEIIKLVPSGGHGYGWSDRYRGLNRAELAAAVAAAHERDARVRAHTSTRDVILECLDAGVDIIDHGDYIDDLCIERMVKQGTFFCPSLFFTKLVSHDGGAGHDDADQHDRAWSNMKTMLKRANEAGVVMVPGDDYGAMGMEHAEGIYARELAIYVYDYGIPAADVLRWATLNGAKLGGREGSSGVIAPGADADLIVVDGDPVANIDILSQPDQYLDVVMLGGRFIKNRLGGDPVVPANGPLHAEMVRNG